MTTDYRAAIQDEVVVEDGVLYTSIRGVATLSGSTKFAVQRYITSRGVGTKQVKKELKTALGKSRYVGTISGITSNDVAAILAHFATSSRVSKDVREQSANMLVAFAARGYEAWASDMLGVKLDSTQSNAAINTLLQQYPGISIMCGAPLESTPISCREFIETYAENLVKEPHLSDYSAEEVKKYLIPRLPAAAAATYRSMYTFDEPGYEMVVVNGKDVPRYIYEDVKPLLVAATALMMKFVRDPALAL